jgi:hypothetical protein
MIMWQTYERWRSIDTDRRPEISLVDGFLAGAAISLSATADEQWIGAIVAGSSDLDQGARDELTARLSSIRADIDRDEPHYAPVLVVTDEGDFDISAWASGFLEAVGPDLEVWAYVLANKQEGGLFGLLCSHAVGPMGGAVRAKISDDPQGRELAAFRSRSWEFIPGLLSSLYRTKLELAGSEGETR